MDFDVNYRWEGLNQILSRHKPLGIKPKKQLGQHFLKDELSASKIVGLLPEDDAPVLEIGPGTGVLTKYLAERRHLQLVEVDDRSVAYLRQRWPQLDIKEVSILEYDWSLASKGPINVIGNLPYYITSPILFSILDFPERWNCAVFMIQKEVAERLVARPRTKEYGILSVQTQVLAEVELVFDVAAESFDPPPKVVSSVVRLHRKAPLKPELRKALKTIVRTAFNQRRKTMRNSLKSLNLEDWIRDNEWLSRRPEELTPFEFVQLSEAYLGYTAGNRT